jgi:XTP/dITP diphosphohydrolase
VDGVALGQPAAALAAKLAARTARAGLPTDLLPGFVSVQQSPSLTTENSATTVFGLIAEGKLAGAEPEGELRAVGRAFAADVRAAEAAARAAGEDPAALSADAWRRHWPAR